MEQRSESGARETGVTADRARLAGAGLRAAVIGDWRMGQAVATVLVERGHEVAARIGRNDDLTLSAGADVAFEFTTAAAAPGNVERLLELGVTTVCGTTGWDASALRERAAVCAVGLLVEPNFALGVAVLNRLVREAAARLLVLPEYAAGVFERHHEGKRDLPSGTALALCASAREASGRAVPAVALRLGEQPGEHQVLFEGPDESLELIHRARSRRLFAVGAVRAAEWMTALRPARALRLDELIGRVSDLQRERS